METGHHLLFTYGILRDSAVMQSILGSLPEAHPAWLEGHVALEVKGENYPGLVVAKGRRVEGTLYSVNEAQLALLDTFEGEMYQRVPVAAQVVGEGPFPASAYLVKPGQRDRLGDKQWLYEDYLARNAITAGLSISYNPHREAHQAAAVVELLDGYACDEMGGGEPLALDARSSLIGELCKRPWVHSWLAEYEDYPVGLLIAVEGFSTFAARPLLNLHDIAVRQGYRGRGIGQALIAAAEAKAAELGCCKATLEVLSGNVRARRLYQHLGYRPYQLDPAQGIAEFWEKRLD